MGGYVLTYHLGSPKLRPAEASPSPPTKKKSSGLFFKKKNPEC